MKLINWFKKNQDKYHVIENNGAIYSCFQGTYDKCFAFWTKNFWQFNNSEIVHQKDYLKRRKRQAKEIKKMNKHIKTLMRERIEDEQ